MPSNRKSSKQSASRLVHTTHSNEPRSNKEDHQLPNSGSGVNRATLPKHITLPPLPSDNEVLFEVIAFVFTAMAFFLQLLNLYRTVWWLPNSHNKHAVHFYLIDVHLVAYVCIILGRRLVWILLKYVLNMALPSSMKRHVLPHLQKLIILLVVLTMIWLICCLAYKHPIVRMPYLLFPVIMYSMLFNASITPFFELLPCHKSILDSRTSKVNVTVVIGKPDLRHICYHEADAVRKEVGMLKTDFNFRLKQVLFNTLLGTYYAGFIPYSFTPNALYIDTRWMTQQILCLLISSFTLYVVYVFSPHYCNILHCSALHLGRWTKIEGPAAHMPHTSWSDGTLWHQGALVKHRKELYRADGISNAAEPGNSAHSRFYIAFRDPSSVLCGIVGLQVTLVISQLALLALSKEWNQIISHSLLLVSNYYTLFKLIRDYLVLGKFYRTEEILQHKSAS